MDESGTVYESDWYLVEVDKKTKEERRRWCPQDSIPGIFKEIVKVENVVTGIEEELIQDLESLIQSEIISKELVSKIVELDIETLERLISRRNPNSVNTHNYLALMNLVYLLNK